LITAILSAEISK